MRTHRVKPRQPSRVRVCPGLRLTLNSGSARRPTDSGVRYTPDTSTVTPASLHGLTQDLTIFSQLSIRCDLIVVELKHCHESLLRRVDRADGLHALLALGLLVEQLLLAGDVATVALGEHGLADGRDLRRGDDRRPDGRLDAHLELRTWDELLELARHALAKVEGGVPVNNRREGRRVLARDENVQPHEIPM